MGLLAQLGLRVAVVIAEETITLFAKAVESETRERLFKPAATDLKQQADERTRRGPLDRSQPEHRFVLFAAGRDKKLTLGEMQRILGATRNSHEGLSVELKSWLTRRLPRWEELIALLDEIAPTRNAAVHPAEAIDMVD